MSTEGAGAQEAVGKVPVVVIGAAGKLGRLIGAALEGHPRLFLAHEVTRASGISARRLSPGTLVIDASSPLASPQYLSTIIESRATLIVLSTGFGATEEQVLRDASREIPVLIAPNTSKALWVFRELVSRAARALSPTFNAAIFEAHHRAKRDAPSGTAKLLQDSLRAVSGVDAPIASSRYGDLPGEHSVFFGGEFERIELVHRVRDRRLFAHGALALALAMVGRSPGIYTPGELWSAEVGFDELKG